MLHVFESTRHALLQVVAALIDNGSGPGRLELLSSDRRVLAVMKFSEPSAPDRPQAGTLTFGPIQVDPSARASGAATIGRVLDGDGTEILECSVSDENGDGVIKLNSNFIAAGGPVKINDFTLSYPRD